MKQIVNCPVCDKAVFHYDGLITNAFEVKCRSCRKLIRIVAEKGDVISVTKISQTQATSSGKRFY